MSKYKFIKNIWITFHYNNSFHIGRTVIKNNIESVVCISENGKAKVITYNQVRQPKSLKILKTKDYATPTNSKNDIHFNLMSN